MGVRRPAPGRGTLLNAARTADAVDQVYRDLAVRVRALRCAYKLSQYDLAMRMGTNERAIRRIEKGLHNVTLKVLVRLAAALGVGVWTLLAPTPPPISELDDPATDGRTARAGKRR
jgi:transcriptional regulator with XRE-family HTH domain